MKVKFLGQKTKALAKKHKKIYLCAGFLLHDPSAVLSIFQFSVNNV